MTHSRIYLYFYYDHNYLCFIYFSVLFFRLALKFINFYLPKKNSIAQLSAHSIQFFFYSELQNLSIKLKLYLCRANRSLKMFFVFCVFFVWSLWFNHTHYRWPYLSQFNQWSIQMIPFQTIIFHWRHFSSID